MSRQIGASGSSFTAVKLEEQTYWGTGTPSLLPFPNLAHFKFSGTSNLTERWLQNINICL